MKSSLATLADLPTFWDAPTPLRLPAPSAPGSATSGEQARANDASGQTQRQLRRVLLWYAAQTEPKTRQDCAAALYTGVSAAGSACGRINTLVEVHHWLAVVGRAGRRELLVITESGRREARRIDRAGGR